MRGLLRSVLGLGHRVAGGVSGVDLLDCCGWGNAGGRVVRVLIWIRLQSRYVEGLVTLLWRGLLVLSLDLELGLHLSLGSRSLVCMLMLLLVVSVMGG